MKEKNTNENPSKRDPWSILQSQFGLLSSPVEHEQVSVVNAVDRQDQDFAPKVSKAFAEGLISEGLISEGLNSEGLNSEGPNSVGSSLSHENETVVVNIDLPAPAESEKDHDSWESPSGYDSANSFDANSFDFDGFGDCDIPKNAFAPPSRSQASRKTETVPQVASETPDFASEPELAENVNVSDPLMSDELPTSLWQPRKPASVSKSKSSTPSLSGDTLRHFGGGGKEGGGKETERKPDTRDRGDAPPPVDDLARHSSGQKRRERGQGQQGKYDDRRSKEPYRKGSDRDRHEAPRRASESPYPRRHHESAPQSSFGRPTFEDQSVESSFDEPAWEEKPQFKDKNRKFDKSPYSADEASLPAAGRDMQEGFAADLDRDINDGKDWLNEDAKTDYSGAGNTRRDRKRPSSAESKTAEPVKDTRHPVKDTRHTAEKSAVEKNTFDKRESPRKEREPLPPSSRSSAAPRPQRRAESPTAESPSQKITVTGWDDAVRDIIEKNMQRRRPAGKTERPSGGRRGPRR